MSITHPLGFFTAMVEQFDVRATFCGHDHVNDYCGLYRGINLCYGGGSGYGTYGKAGWDRRSRVIYLENFGNKISTWKRLHNPQLSVKDKEVLYEYCHQIEYPLRNPTSNLWLEKGNHKKHVNVKKVQES